MYERSLAQIAIFQNQKCFKCLLIIINMCFLNLFIYLICNGKKQVPKYWQNKDMYNVT